MFDSIDPSSTHVALLTGGISGEREISLASKDGALQALNEAGYDVTVFDTADKRDLETLVAGSYDVAFLALHGKGGEDGTIQGFLESINLPYTGSGVCSSAISIDKKKAKLFYEQAHIPTPHSVNIQEGEPYDVNKIIDYLGETCVVKAATEGSSLGVYIVEGLEEIAQAIEEVFEIDSSIVIERYIKGREFTVVVLGSNDEARALPIIEIIPKNDSYDFDSKYLPGGSEHICPAALSEKQTNELSELAIRAHKCLGCEGVSRTDILIEEDGSPWVLETNTIPGMTTTSLLPDAARAAGISFPDLCTFLITEALKKSM